MNVQGDRLHYPKNNLRMNDKQVLTLLRHGTALKNVENRHGGVGTDLASASISETMAVGNELLGFGIRFDEIVFAPRRQCEQTAQLLSGTMGTPCRIEPALTPIGLGIIDGLSNEEVSERYPKISQMMGKWRKGEIEIDQVNIPGMELRPEFYHRGSQFLLEIKSSRRSTIVVATRSILILLTSIMLRRTPSPGGNYRDISWDNCKYITFTFGKWGAALELDLSYINI